ncbi:MAG: TIGR03618 family F420-dependent PPOX class oxidoreductase [Actinomycetes bacterium]
MSALGPDVRAFVDAEPSGVLGTLRTDGRPRLSVVRHVLDGERILISTEATRAKARDVARDGRASYCVTGHDAPYPCVTVEGPARIVTEGAGAATTRIFERMSGAPMPEPLSDDTVAAMGRVIIELTIERAYGATHIPEA